MKFHILLLGSALALSSVSLLSAKTYDIILGSPTQAGTLNLGSGEYRLALEGSNAVFTNVENGKKFTTPIKVEKATKKFDNTAVETDQVNGADRVKAIDLGGSTTQLDFSGD